MERLSIKVRIDDEEKSAYYSFRMTFLVKGGLERVVQASIYLTDYDGENQFGPPERIFVYAESTLLEGYTKALQQFRVDLTYRKHAHQNQEGTRRVPSD